MKYIVTSHAYKHQTPNSTRKPLIWQDQQKCMQAKWETLFIFTSLSAFVRYVYHKFSCFNMNESLSKLWCGVAAVADVAVFNFTVCV